MADIGGIPAMPKDVGGFVSCAAPDPEARPEPVSFVSLPAAFAGPPPKEKPPPMLLAALVLEPKAEATGLELADKEKPPLPVDEAAAILEDDPPVLAPKPKPPPPADEDDDEEGALALVEEAGVVPKLNPLPPLPKLKAVAPNAPPPDDDGAGIGAKPAAGLPLPPPPLPPPAAFTFPSRPVSQATHTSASSLFAVKHV